VIALQTTASVEPEIAYQWASLPAKEMTGLLSFLASSSLDATQEISEVRRRQVSSSREASLFAIISNGTHDIPSVLELIGIPHDTPLVPQKNRMACLKIDVNRITDLKSQSFLHMACAMGDLELVKVLIYLAGSLVNQRDARGWTPLHCAAAGSHMEIIKVLAQCQGTQVETRYVSRSSGFDIICEDEEQPGWVYPPDGPIVADSNTLIYPWDERVLDASDVAPNRIDSKEIRRILKGTFCSHSLTYSRD
jgi:hypothetical protein